MTRLLFSLMLLVFPVTTISASPWKAVIEKEALRKALQEYTECNQNCAIELATIIIDKGIDQAIDLVASIPNISSEKNKNTSAEKNKKLRIALFYALARRSAERGEKIMSSHGACSNSCDKLNSDIVELARAGALGPMLKDDKVDPEIFKNQRILEIYLKYVKPIPPNQLPWTFHNDEWWKKIGSTG